MNLKEQAEIIAAAIAGKDLLLQKRSGGIRTRFSPGPDLRFNFQDYIYEVADEEPKSLSIEAQARILGAASLGEPIEMTNFPITDASVWWPVSFPHGFNFSRNAYRIAEKKPKTKVLHQYIIQNQISESYTLSTYFHPNEESARRATNSRIIGPATWTRIEVQA